MIFYRGKRQKASQKAKARLVRQNLFLLPPFAAHALLSQASLYVLMTSGAIHSFKKYIHSYLLASSF
jgi:hypothetical protein